MNCARFLMLAAVFGSFGCASASDGEPQASFVASPTSVRPQQAPAVEKSAIAAQTASASQATASATQQASAAAVVPPTDDDEPDAELVESGVMSDAQRAIMRGVARCFERALRTSPAPGGSLALALTVDAEGAVTQLELGPGYPANARACVEARVKSVRFPKEPGGGIRHYRYPINEQPAEEPAP